MSTDADRPPDEDSGDDRAERNESRDDRFTRYLVDFNEFAERAIAVAVVLVLVVIAALILFETGGELVRAGREGELPLIKALSEVLLALMIAEIIGTVSTFLQRGVFVAVPFLVVAVIASVRRLLVISAESAELFASGNEIPQAFLIELGILTVTIGVCAWAIGYLRTSRRGARDPGPATT